MCYRLGFLMVAGKRVRLQQVTEVIRAQFLHHSCDLPKCRVKRLAGPGLGKMRGDPCRLRQQVRGNLQGELSPVRPHAFKKALQQAKCMPDRPPAGAACCCSCFSAHSAISSSVGHSVISACPLATGDGCSASVGNSLATGAGCCCSFSAPSACGAASGTASGAASGTASGAASDTASGAASDTASGAASDTASGAASDTASGAAAGTASGASCSHWPY